MAVRRLPVVQEPTGEDAEAAARPAWQWVLIGSGLLVTVWAPLAAVVGALARVFPSISPGIAAALIAGSLAVAAGATGYLVSRFGSRASLRHAVFAGLAGAAELWLVGLLGGAYGSTLVGFSALVSLTALSAAFCAIGARLARRVKVRR
jgi:hypothetical protein